MLDAARGASRARQTTLTLLGSGFAAGMAASFGPGIAAVGAGAGASADDATLSMQVSAQAPAITRVPSLSVGGEAGTRLPEATLTVTAAAPRARRRGPTRDRCKSRACRLILAVSPARLFTGQTTR